MDASTLIAFLAVGLTINGALLAYVVRVERRLSVIETVQTTMDASIKRLKNHVYFDRRKTQ